MAVRRGQLGIERGEDVQLRSQRHAVVQVVGVAARPEEGFPTRALQPGEVDVPAAKDGRVFLGEVVTHYADQVHAGEEAGRDRAVRCCASERPRNFAKWSFERVERDRPNDEERHAGIDRKSTRLNSSHVAISYAVFCLKKKK